MSCLVEAVSVVSVTGGVSVDSVSGGEDGPGDIAGDQGPGDIAGDKGPGDGGVAEVGVSVVSVGGVQSISISLTTGQGSDRQNDLDVEFY